MTSSSGKVACLPAGTPGSSAPVIRKESTTTNYPDGSAKTTETTYTRDPQTGAQETSQQITNTTATGGGAGQAGMPGTTNTTGSSGTTTGDNGTTPSAEPNDFCRNNPTLQICKGDMNKEETQLAIKALLDPKDPADKSALDQAKADYETNATEYKTKIDDIGAKAQNNEGIFTWALIPEPPSGSCEGFTGTLMGRQINLDWCSTLEKIRQIAGYAFYILTAFGLFRIFANMKGGE